jgi:ribosomal protein S18 acetylase RimI-like enzyme
VITDLDLARTLETAEAQRQADYARVSARIGGDGAFLEVGGGVVVSLGMGYPVNRGFALGVNDTLETAHLEALEAFLGERGLAPELDLCPFADGTTLERLAQRGYHARGFLNMYALTGEPRVAVLPTLEVRELHAEELEVWQDVSLEAWGVEATQTAWKTLAWLGFQLPRSMKFAVWQDKKPVAVGALQIRDDLATLYGGGTIPEARGRGAQTALLYARLEAARLAGCTIITSQANPNTPSSRNLERAGFRLAYTKVRFAAKRSDVVSRSLER